jgi:hypothetical protein
MGQNLFIVNLGNSFDRFDLDDHLIFNDQVCPKADIKSHVFVNDRDRLLAFDAKSASFQFSRKYRLINRLEQTGTETLVNFQGSVNDAFSDFIFSHYPLPKETNCVLGFALRSLRLCAFARNKGFWLRRKFYGQFLAKAQRSQRKGILVHC